jgi:hypothetical protein
MTILRVPCESGYRPMVSPRKVLGRSVKDRLQVQDSMATGGKHGTEVVPAFAPERGCKKKDGFERVARLAWFRESLPKWCLSWIDPSEAFRWPEIRHRL